jgi:hypothetical protein
VSVITLNATLGPQGYNLSRDGLVPLPPVEEGWGGVVGGHLPRLK